MVHQAGTVSPELNLAETMEWLELLHGESPGKINIVSSADWRGRGFDIRDQIDGALEYINELDQRNVQGVYLRCTTIAEMPREGRGSAKDSLAMPGLWADIDRAGPGHKDAFNLPVDFAQALRIVEMAQLPVPSYWVESGGGWYAWWVLQNPHIISGDLDRLTTLSRDWHQALSIGAELADCRYPTGTHDLARVLRIPGTVNRKVADLPRACYLGRKASTGILYQAEELESSLASALANLKPPAAPVTVDLKPAGAARAAGVSPLDAFEEQVDWSDILEPAGWTLSHQTGRERFWVRPGKNPRDGHSATTGLDVARDRLYVFSTEVSGFQAGECYTKAWAWSIIHNIPRTQLPTELRKLGYGEPWQESVRLEEWQSAPFSGGPAAPAATTFESDFWSSRPVLKQIHDAAHSRGCSAEAVLGVVLARVAAQTSNRVRIPAMVGTRSSLTAFSVIVGPSGNGKSVSANVGTALLPWHYDEFYDNMPVGTGEGIAEAYYGAVEDSVIDPKTGKDKTVTKRKVVRHNVLFYVDEGQAMAQLSKRSGSTLLQTLRSAFSGSTLGAMNASEERRRIVPGADYSMGLVMGLQEPLAADLLDDADGGTPQRCLWFRASDETVPHPRQAPRWPGAIDWRPPAVPATPGEWIGESQTDAYDLDFDQTIWDEVQEQRWLVVTGQLTLDHLDSHAMLVRLKVAALLALLDSRLNVTADDWAVAAAIMENSNMIRERVVGILAEARKFKAEKVSAARLAESMAIEDGRERELTARAQQRITRKLAEAGNLTRKALQNFLSSAQREYLDVAIDSLVAAGRAEEISEPGRGEDVRLIRLVT